MRIMKAMFYKCNDRGAAGILPLIFSTIGGGAFLFTFYNLTQYTAARSAAEQAARRAARCLTPTDAECKDINPSGLNNSGNQNNWFGYRPGTGPTTVQYDAYTYNAQVFATKFGAQYNSYDVLTGNPIVLHQETEIKPTRFLGLLNSYQRLRADVTIYVRKNRVEKTCRIKEAVQLPAGLDFTKSQTYFDNRWCGEVGDVLVAASRVSGCSDVSDGTWRLAQDPSRNNSFCGLTLPTPRNPGEQPWLQLGGDPICDGEREAPFKEIPLGELSTAYKDVYGSNTEPGTKGRAYPVTGARQFVVVEVYSCNPEAFKSSLRAAIKTKDDLVKYFKSYNKIDADGFRGNPDFDERGGASAFVYQGAEGVSVLAPQNWTYFEWSRMADGLRHLERRVCSWVTFDEAKNLYPEFLNGKTASYVSGNQFGQDVKTIKLFDGPSCLSPKRETLKYNCPNRTIAGQSGALNDCNGWTAEQTSLENIYKQNAEAAIALNSNQTWANFEALKTNFISKIEPRFSPNIGNQIWEFSWSDSEYQGIKIENPTAVRPHNGVNPKTLPANYLVDSFERSDGSPDPLLESRIREAIERLEDHKVDTDMTFQATAGGESRPVEIAGSWPFIKDTSGASVPTARPYVNPQVNGSGFDFDLNCSPDDQCLSGNTTGSMEELLRGMAVSAVNGLNLSDTGYKFAYQETLIGPQYVDLNTAQSLPACTQFRTLCGKGVASGNPISLGSSQNIPLECQNGTYVNCYPEYLSSQIATEKYDTVILKDLARMRALGEIKRLNPQANLCSEIDQANCVTVDIQQNGSQMEIAVKFAAPLTTPFKEILSRDTLIVSAIKREIIETARLEN